MRILMISDHADPLAKVGTKEAGGQNIFVYYVARHLAKLGVTVDVYTRWDNARKREVTHVSKNLRVIRVQAGPRAAMPRDAFLTVLPEFTRNIEKRMLDEHITYDIVFTNYWFSGVAGLEIAERHNLPLVHVYHSIGKIRFETLQSYRPQDSDYLFFQKRLACEAEIARKATAIVSTSPVEKALITDIFRIPARKVIVIPIGVNTERFKPIASHTARAKLQLPPHIPLILYVGRMEWRKGVGTLLYAFRNLQQQYPESKLLLVGGERNRKLAVNSEEFRLSNIAAEIGISQHVLFLGPKDQDDLYLYYNAADVVVVPSYYEPFGIVPLEAMACGTPVVASATGGLKYTVVPKQTGEHAEPRNYTDLAVQIQTVLNRGKESYTQACLDRIQSVFQWDLIAETYAETFTRLIRSYYENSHARPLRRTSATQKIRRH